jgi:hypothetical protein
MFTVRNVAKWDITRRAIRGVKALVGATSAGVTKHAPVTESASGVVDFLASVSCYCIDVANHIDAFITRSAAIVGGVTFIRAGLKSYYEKKRTQKL